MRAAYVALASASLMLTTNSVIAQDLVERWSDYDGNLYPSLIQACGAIVANHAGTDPKVKWSNPRLRPGNNNDLCDIDVETCFGFATPGNVEGCPEDRRRFSESFIRAVYSQVVDDTPSCQSLQGDTQHIEFTHYLDGPLPDLAPLFCQNSCQLDGTINTNVQYQQFGGVWEPASETYSGTLTFTGTECSAELAGAPDPAGSTVGAQDPTPNDPPQCTADYYTSPQTGVLVCGTPPQSTTADNGTTTTTETTEDGTKVTTVETPDGTTTVTESHPDGSVSTVVTNPDGSSQSEFGPSDSDDDQAEADECPSNQYQLVNGELQCKGGGEETTGEALEGLEGLVAEGNQTLEAIEEEITGFIENADTLDYDFGTEADDELASVTEEFNSTIENLTTSLKETFAVELASAQYTCNRSYTVLGVTLNFCLPADTLALLPLLGAVVLLTAHIQALFIVFG